MHAEFLNLLFLALIYLFFVYCNYNSYNFLLCLSIVFGPYLQNLRTDPVIAEHLLSHQDNVARLMKMERKSGMEVHSKRWFPYLDRFRCGSEYLSSKEVIEVVGPILMEERKERLKRW